MCQLPVDISDIDTNSFVSGAMSLAVKKNSCDLATRDTSVLCHLFVSQICGTRGSTCDSDSVRTYVRTYVRSFVTLFFTHHFLAFNEVGVFRLM